MYVLFYQFFTKIKCISELFLFFSVTQHKIYRAIRK